MAFYLCACGEPPRPGPDAGQTFAVGGSVTGLLGVALVIQNNGADDLTIASDGPFVFATHLQAGATYAVTVLTQPNDPSQTCTVANHMGTIANSDIDDVAIACTMNSYPVGGTVTGLLGSGLVLKNNGGDDLAIAADGSFAFDTPIPSGAQYLVTVSTNPGTPTQACTVSNGSGTIAGTPITNVTVLCANTYTIGGTISGLTLPGLALASPGQADLSLGAGATTFTFPTALPPGSSYAVTVKSQPEGQRCTPEYASGTVASEDIVTIAIHCVRLWISVKPGGKHTVGVTADGTLWVWGEGSSGELCNGENSAYLTPTAIGSGFRSATAGMSHTLALKADWTMWGCGLNSNGQLGDGTGVSKLSLVQVRQAGLVTVAAGYQHSAALAPNNGLWTWGRNDCGQVGDGSLANRYAPVPVGSQFASVAPSLFHTAGVKTDGTLWTWGDNQYGQLGDGTTTRQIVPIQVGTDFTSVATGKYFTVAVKTDGTLWAWGHNSWGQLGDGTTTMRTSPVQVGTGFAAVAAGAGHTLGLKADGTLWAWGNNSVGEVGNGTTVDQHTPVQVGTGFASVAAFEFQSIAIKTDGTLWAWGSNYFGQLGDGTKTTRTRPVQIP